MKHSSVTASGLLIVLIVLSALLLPLVLAGCRSTPEPAAIPENRPQAVPEPEEKPDPFLTDWAGTTWIVRDVPEGSGEFPGYRGFHLGRDGRLLLINLDSAVGDSWSAEGNRLRMGLLDGVPSIPVEGFFEAFVPEDAAGGAPVRMRLVSEAAPDFGGLILEQAIVNVDIIENHWIPRSLRGGDTVMWPMNREIHLILLPDAVGGIGILGFGGENRFRGEMDLGVDSFTTGPISRTRRTGPASEYEDLYIRRISEAERFVQVDDDLFLYAETRPVAGFRVRLFD